MSHSKQTIDFTDPRNQWTSPLVTWSFSSTGNSSQPSFGWLIESSGWSVARASALLCRSSKIRGLWWSGGVVFCGTWLMFVRNLTKNLATHLYTFQLMELFERNTYLQLANLPQLTYNSNSSNGHKQINTLEVGFVSGMGFPNHWPLNEASRSHRRGDFLWCLGGWCMDCHRWCGALVL